MMLLQEPVPEELMIAEFLRAEWDSPRARPFMMRCLDSALGSLTQFDTWLRQPDLEDELQNCWRSNLLGGYRGYGRNRLLFQGFPSDTLWYRSSLSITEVRDCLYVRNSDWLRDPGGSRRVVDNMCWIRPDELQVFQQALPNLKLAPNPILVSGMDSRTVILEGHFRLTAYTFLSESPALQFRVLIGFSPQMPDWFFYS